MVNSSHSKVSVSTTTFKHKRYIGYIILTIVLLILPFIRIGGNHIFLLSFDHKVLHLMGIEYSIQELYVMPFMLIILFVGIFFMTVMGGRIWCGWGCPQTLFRTIYRDIIQTKLLKLRKRTTNKQEILVLDTFSKKVKFGIGVILFACIALIATADFLFFFVPPEDFFVYIRDFDNHHVLFGFWTVITAFMTIEVCFIAENFCIYMCPYARVQSVFFDNDTLMSVYNLKRGGAVYAPTGEAIGIAPKKQNPENECTNCHHCVKVCPTHIDIRKGVQLECIHCLECVDACSEVMGKLGRPSLVNWSSPNATEHNTKVRLFRAKTIGYMVLLGLAFGALIVMGTLQKTMLLNITRTAETYIIRESGAIDNAYKFVIQNVDKTAHKFSFEVDGDMADKFEIIIPDHGDTKEFFIDTKPDNTKILVIILRAKENLNPMGQSDKSIPLVIRGFAVDNKDTITTKYSTVFIYPSQENIDKKLKQ